MFNIFKIFSRDGCNGHPIHPSQIKTVRLEVEIDREGLRFCREEGERKFEKGLTEYLADYVLNLYNATLSDMVMDGKSEAKIWVFLGDKEKSIRECICIRAGIKEGWEKKFWREAIEKLSLIKVWAIRMPPTNLFISQARREILTYLKDKGFDAEPYLEDDGDQKE